MLNYLTPLSLGLAEIYLILARAKSAYTSEQGTMKTVHKVPLDTRVSSVSADQPYALVRL